MSEVVRKIIGNIEKVIIGKHDVVTLIMAALLSRGHVLIEDIPGVGKTMLAEALAVSVNGVFKRVQFTTDLMPSDITGFSMFNPSTREFEYRQGAAHCNFLLADEINRTSPKTQSSLLEVMEECQVTVDGKTWELPKPFMVLATQNPIECYGTYPLPEAQMDRFFMKVSLGYPGRENEKSILEKFGAGKPIASISQVADNEEIIELQEKTEKIHVSNAIIEYILDIVEGTRKHADIRLGASPRGTLALLRGAKSLAFICGRDYVIPDDVVKISKPVLAHRLICKETSGQKEKLQEEIIDEVLGMVKVPFIPV